MLVGNRIIERNKIIAQPTAEVSDLLGAELLFHYCSSG